MNRCYCFLFSFFILIQVWYTPVKAQNHAQVAVKDTGGQKKTDQLNITARAIYLSSPTKARKIAQEALLLSKKINYSSGIGQSFLNMGITYWAQSYYPISLFYLNTALQYFQNTDHSYKSDCYRSIGRDYVDLKNYKQGLYYLIKAEKEAGNDLDEEERALSERSYAFLKLRQYDKSIADVYKALKLCRQIDKKDDIPILYSRLYSIYIEKKQFEKASAYCDTAYTLSFTTNNKRLRSTVWIGRAAIAFNQKRYPDAINNAQTAAQMADSLGIMDISSYANRWLYRIYDITGNKDKAIFYQKRYILLQDSLNKLDKQNSLQLIQDYFSLNTKLHDIEQIAHNNEVNTVLIRSQRNTIINLGITILVLLVALYILYRFYKQKNKLSTQLQLQHLELIVKNQLIETQSANLNELNQQKARLLTIIGHDLRTPLNNLKNIVDLFGQDYFSTDEVQQLMKDMAPAIKGAELTLSNLVEWAGSEVKGNTIDITPVDLLNIITETAHIFEHPLAQKNIALTIDIPADLSVMADNNHLRMILRNLISNAIKFSPASGSISLSAQSQGNKILISVKDTGKGMTTEEVSSLFSNQTHFSKTGTGGEKGTGIGLLLCRQLVELNGGEIGVDSIPGQGSVFYFTLPVA